MKIVLDSNVLLVAVGKRSRYRPIWDAFISGHYQLIISEDVIHEYEEILKLYSAVNVAGIVMEIFLESPDVIIKEYIITGMRLSMILMIINFLISR